MKLRVGISPCPNDTFAFHGILERRVDLRGLEIEIEFADVQALNDGLVGGRYDLSKASFHQALLLTDRFGVIRAGSALGFGVGPLLVSAEPRHGTQRTRTRAVPRPDHHRNPALPLPAPPPGGDPAHGVLGHRRRATRRRRGHRRAHPRGPADLRARRPDPARGPRHVVRAARRCAGAARRDSRSSDAPGRVRRTFNAVLQDSIAYAWANREDTLPTIRRHAQEMGEDVIWPYVELYVNDNTFDLGDEGERSLRTLERTGIDAGVLPATGRRCRSWAKPDAAGGRRTTSRAGAAARWW